MNASTYEDLAEIIGIILGDGCLYLDKKHKYHTIISFNLNEEQYLLHVKALMEIYFQGYKFYTTRCHHEFLLRNVSVKVGQYLLDVGLHVGDKIKAKSDVPPWILTNDIYVERFMKGLFDTDGCVYRKYDAYAQLQFKFGSEIITKSTHDILLRLRYRPTRVQREPNHQFTGWKVYLSRQPEIERFFNTIQPANQKHWQRYKKIKLGTPRFERGLPGVTILKQETPAT